MLNPMTNRTNIWAGELVRLRAFEPSDADVLHAVSFDTESQRLGSRQVRYPGSLASARKQNEEQATHDSPDGYTFRLAIEALESGELVGDVGTHQAEPLHGVFSYGVRVFREHRGKGYASEAIVLLLRYCFLELRMHKANAGVWSFNEASLALQRKLGFIEEGRLRDNIFSNGAHHDEYRFGMTDAEFLARYGRG